MMTFLAATDYSALTGLILPITVVTLSMSIPIVAIITEHLQKKDRMRLMEKAIEHGANLEALDIEDPKPRPRLPYRSGMISIAVGGGLFLSDHFLNVQYGDFHFPLAAAGIITGSIGVALLANDWLNRKRIDQEGA